MRILSFSQMQQFQQCPFRWHLRYELGWRPRIRAISLVFGGAIHRAIADWLRGKTNYPRVGSLDEITVPGDWMYHHQTAQAMLGQFEKHVTKLDFQSVFVERAIERLGFRGTIDCLADVGKERLVIDWKTASRDYHPDMVHLDDQLTAYAYLVGGDSKIDGVAFVTLRKPDGQIKWYKSVRTSDQIAVFVQKVEQVREQMDARVRYSNFDFVHPFGCQRCSFLQYCLGKEELSKNHERPDF